MINRIALTLCLIFVISDSIAKGQTITTYAGPQLPVTGSQALSQPIDRASSVATDGAGGVYFVSPNENRVYRVSASGTLSTFAGNGTYGFRGDGGRATAAQLASPWGVAVDSTGAVYITDAGNNRVRKITSDGRIATVADSLTGLSGIAVDTSGNIYVAQSYAITKLTSDGTSSTVVYLNNSQDCPAGLGIDASGNVLVADCSSGRILEISSSGEVTTLFGAGFLVQPRSIAVDSKANLYIADSGLNCIWEVTPSYEAGCVVGGGQTNYNFFGFGCSPLPIGQHYYPDPAPLAVLVAPSGVALDSTGNLYIADAGANPVRKALFPLDSGSFMWCICPGGYICPVSVGIISPVAGSSITGYQGDGGSAVSATLNLNSTSGLALDAKGNLYIGDTGNNRVRQVSTDGLITTIAGDGTFGLTGGSSPQLGGPSGVAIDAAGNLLIAESGANRIRKFSSGVLSIVAGNGTRGRGIDGVSATVSPLANPTGVIVDSSNIYIADSSNGRVREVTPNGLITTIAGNGSTVGDGGLASQAALISPSSIATDGAGNIYIADPAVNRVRKIGRDGLITTVAGTGTAGFSGDGSPATLAQLSAPSGVAADTKGNVYVADRGNNRLRRVAPDGTISTLAGNGVAGFSGDGSLPLAAQLAAPSAVTLDSVGNLYIVDSGNSRIRKIDVSALPRVGSFAQVASGGGWKTTLTIVNLSDVAVTARLNFYADAGTPLVLPLTLSDGSHVTDSSVSLTLQPRGSGVIETEAPTTDISTGWAEVRASGFVSGYSIFRQRIGGLPDSEGTTDLDITPGPSILFSYDNTAGFQTGVALVNLSNSDSKIASIVRDDTGVIIGQSTLSVPALGHTSFFVSGNFPASASKRGTIEFSGVSDDVTGIGLRFSPSLSFTSIPIIR